MKICGVICELNPFHYGHEYLFRKARKITGADYVIAVMSGDFVQRGMPAICDKYSRTIMALKGGADIVLELPSIYSTASADYFAYGAVSILNSLGCVDFLCFGTESGDIEVIRKYVDDYTDSNIEDDISDENLDLFDDMMAKSSTGISYAKKMAMLNGSMGPNDMLASCYLKNITKLGSTIKPIAIKRVGSGYFDESNSSTSATAIRKMIFEEEDISQYVPDYVFECFEDISYEYFPITLNDFSVQLFTRLDTIVNGDNELELTDYMDVSANIAGRIKSNLYDFTDYENFLSAVHSKEYTKSRVMRALLHILLDIKKTDYPEELLESSIGFVRILGFKNDASKLLSIIKECSLVPVVSKAKDAGRLLDEDAFHIFMKDIHCANLYEQCFAFKYGNSPVHDYSKQIVII